jgi:SynChlorMet cassette radical SAM/SPASM protein ScmF
MPCETERLAGASTDLEASQTGAELDLPAGVPPLRSLYVYASGACNLACRHCWITPTYQPDGDGDQHIQLEHVRKAIWEAKPLGLASVKLTGGEPTLHPQFRELVTLIDQADLAIMIETNGTLTDDDLAGFLRQTSHSPFISVSLDGADAQTHDALRAVPGSFDRALKGVRALIRAGFHPQIICTLHRGNVSQVAEYVAMAGELGCGSVKFNLLQEMGRGEQLAELQGLGIAEIIDLHRRVERELVPRNQLRIHFDIPFAFQPIPRLLRGSLNRCGILTILGLLSGGELALCGIGTAIPELVYGHIAHDDLVDVWCSSSGLSELRAQIPAKLEGICGQCLHRDMCLGSCVASNYYTTGTLNAPYQFCDRAHTLGLFPATRQRMGESQGS